MKEQEYIIEYIKDFNVTHINDNIKKALNMGKVYVF